MYEEDTSKLLNSNLNFGDKEKNTDLIDEDLLVPKNIIYDIHLEKETLMRERKIKINELLKQSAKQDSFKIYNNLINGNELNKENHIRKLEEGLFLPSNYIDFEKQHELLLNKIRKINKEKKIEKTGRFEANKNRGRSKKDEEKVAEEPIHNMSDNLKSKINFSQENELKKILEMKTEKTENSIQDVDKQKNTISAQKSRISKLNNKFNKINGKKNGFKLFNLSLDFIDLDKNKTLANKNLNATDNKIDNDRIEKEVPIKKKRIKIKEILSQSIDEDTLKLNNSKDDGEELNLENDNEKSEKELLPPGNLIHLEKELDILNKKKQIAKILKEREDKNKSEKKLKTNNNQNLSNNINIVNNNYIKKAYLSLSARKPKKNLFIFFDQKFHGLSLVNSKKTKRSTITIKNKNRRAFKSFRLRNKKKILETIIEKDSEQNGTIDPESKTATYSLRKKRKQTIPNIEKDKKELETLEQKNNIYYRIIENLKNTKQENSINNEKKSPEKKETIDEINTVEKKETCAEEKKIISRNENNQFSKEKNPEIENDTSKSKEKPEPEIKSKHASFKNIPYQQSKTESNKKIKTENLSTETTSYTKYLRFYRNNYSKEKNTDIKKEPQIETQKTKTIINSPYGKDEKNNIIKLQPETQKEKKTVDTERKPKSYYNKNKNIRKYYLKDKESETENKKSNDEIIKSNIRSKYASSKLLNKKLEEPETKQETKKNNCKTENNYNASIFAKFYRCYCKKPEIKSEALKEESQVRNIDNIIYNKTQNQQETPKQEETFTKSYSRYLRFNRFTTNDSSQSKVLKTENKEEFKLIKPLYSKYTLNFYKNKKNMQQGKKESPIKITKKEKIKSSNHIYFCNDYYSIEKDKDFQNENSVSKYATESSKKINKFYQWPKDKDKSKELKSEEGTKSNEKKYSRFRTNKYFNTPKIEMKQEIKEEKNIRQASYQKRKFYKDNINYNNNKEKENENGEIPSLVLKDKLNFSTNKKNSNY